jgi:hypothetical protein
MRIDNCLSATSPNDENSVILEDSSKCLYRPSKVSSEFSAWKIVVACYYPCLAIPAMVDLHGIEE